MSTHRINDDFDHDSSANDTDLDQFAARFDPAITDRQARRARKPLANPHERRKKTAPDALVDQFAADEGAGLDTFQTTYHPARFEEGWLLSSIRPFYDDTLITDVLQKVKGGKEASVYCCAANPNTGHELLAVKVYRPRALRNLRNDAQYREGREYLGVSGKLNENDMREMRAIRKKTAYGVELQHGSWINYEYTMLETLFKAGAAVPQPISVGENAILMGYIGDESTAAPTLNGVSLGRLEAQTLLDEVIRNVHLLLKAGWIHGDLSAYNILYWNGAITLIDFPQVTSVNGNRSAEAILTRDIQRVCEYFVKQGVRCDYKAIAARLWRLYIDANPNQREADQSWHEPQDD